LYDREFKLEAVRMVLEKGNGARETARLLGISGPLTGAYYLPILPFSL
jgi:transposase-like protein